MRYLAIAGLLAAAVHAAEVPVESKITAVTVYQDRAVVTRSASVAVANGISELVLANLPESLNEQSLQVAAKGDTAATILEVSSRQTYVDQTPNPRVKELEEQLTELRKQTRDINNKTGLLASRSSALEKMENAFFAPPSKDVARPEPGQFDASLKYLMDQRSQISADRTTLDDEQTELKNRIDTVQRQLKEISASGKKAFKTVTVRLAAEQPGRLDIDLAYTVPNASWTPDYDVRDDSTARTARLDYFGIVRQTTGED